MNPEEAHKRFLFLIFMKKRLPTILYWGDNLLKRKRGITIAFALFCGIMIIRESMMRYYDVIPPCDQPCQDAVNCDPLQFSFEVRQSRIKSRQPQDLWFRAEIKNRSCRRLESIYVKEFLNPTDLNKSTAGLWVSVTGPDGKELPRRPVPAPGGGMPWDNGSARRAQTSTQGTIYPYQPDMDIVKKIRLSKKMEDLDFIALDPGESFVTVPFRLQPYRKSVVSIKTGDAVGDGIAKVPVKDPPPFPQPPDGFSLLDRYVFPNPGLYQVTSGFIGRLQLYSIYGRWEQTPGWLRSIFWEIGIHPKDEWQHQKREVSLVAPPVTIEAVK